MGLMSNLTYLPRMKRQLELLKKIRECDVTVQSIDRIMEKVEYPNRIYTESKDITDDSDDFYPESHSYAIQLDNAPAQDEASIVRGLAHMMSTLGANNGVETVITESGLIEEEPGLLDNPTKMGNLEDYTGMVVDEEKAGMTRNTQTGQENLLDLDEFFARPIPLTNFQIPMATDVNVEIKVWDEFANNPSIRAKLRNYAYLRGDLHVRIAMSGMPFHYGRLLASYQPYPEKNENIANHVTSMGFLSTWRPLFLNYLSQAPGSVTLDPKENQPVDIVCPFISAKPMHRLYNYDASVISDVTSFVDLENAGSLFIYSLNQFASTSATPSDVSVYVYAWMENVQLGTISATQVGITTESGEIKEDEFAVGPVERIATGAAEIADALSVVPSIGMFAKASSMMFRGAASMASIFGWSKPVTIDTPRLVKNMGYQNGAHMIGHDTNYRITLDPKQELTVDPRVMGSEEDEMVIAHIASRESYLTTFTWADDSPVMQSPIWVSAVTPILCTTTSNVAEIYAQPTAMAFAATPFEYWRGTIKFRIEIVCSAFHKGKLAIYYEPNIAQEVLIDAALDTNKQYMRVIDIAKTQTIEFCVNWAHPFAWSDVYVNNVNRAYGSLFLPSLYYTSANGYIGITPLTTLQSPDDSDISINVYVSCEDLQVNQLVRTISDRRVITESGDISFSHAVECIDLNESSADAKYICLEHFGERPLSFRALLKRYVKSSEQAFIANGSAVKTLLSTFNSVPDLTPSYGNNELGDLFGYLRYAFVGLRGGIRKRLHYWSDLDQTYLAQCKVTLDAPATTVIPSTSITTTASSASIRGSVSFVPQSNGGVEVEIPFYSRNLFAFSFANDLVGTNGSGEMDTSWTKSYTLALDASGSTSAGTVNEESAAAEDFCLLRYQGAPFYRLV